MIVKCVQVMNLIVKMLIILHPMKMRLLPVGCPFHLYVVMMINEQSFHKRKYEHTHTCLRVQNNPDASGAWIAKNMGSFIRS